VRSPFQSLGIERCDDLCSTWLVLVSSSINIMALGKTILINALTNVPRYSFTRQAIIAAHTDPDLVESIFGKGIEPERALVREWEEQGLKAIAPRTEQSGEGVSVTVPKGKSQREVDFEALRAALERRIRWSSNVGEHLVQVCLSPPIISPPRYLYLIADGRIGTCVTRHARTTTINRLPETRESACVCFGE
jgi:hypothetical protein